MIKRLAVKRGLMFAFSFEVADVDATHQKLKAANVQGLTDIIEQGYGRTFDAKDPD